MVFTTGTDGEPVTSSRNPYPNAVPLQSKSQRWQRKNKVNGRLMPAKNQPLSLGYKAMQWGTGSNGNAPRSGRMRNFNRRPA